MSKINLHNYEAFYLDYIEGNLNAEDTAELLLFLEKNVDLKAELEDFELITLDPKEEAYLDFSDLKKEITPSNAEEYIIGSIESQLNEEDEKELAIVISKNEDLQKLAIRYSKTILPRSLMEFTDKNKLKKKRGILVIMSPIRRVAAVGLLLIALIPLLTQETEVEFADNKKPISFAKNDSSIRPKKDSVSLDIFQKNSATESAFESTQLAEKTSSDLRNIPTLNKPFKKTHLATNIHIASIEPKKCKQIQITKIKEDLAMNKLHNAIAFKPKELLANVESEPQTIGEWLNQSIRKRVFKDSEAKDDKIQGNELLTTAATLLQEKTNTNIAFTHRASASNTSYTFSVGKFSFSKTKNN